MLDITVPTSSTRGRKRGRGVKRRRAPQHCSDCGHVKQKGPFSLHHVPSLPRARQSSSNIGAGRDGVADGTKCACPEDLWRKELKSHSKVKEMFGSECNCKGDEHHPWGLEGIRIGV